MVLLFSSMLNIKILNIWLIRCWHLWLSLRSMHNTDSFFNDITKFWSNAWCHLFCTKAFSLILNIFLYLNKSFINNFFLLLFILIFYLCDFDWRHFDWKSFSSIYLALFIFHTYFRNGFFCLFSSLNFDSSRSYFWFFRLWVCLTDTRFFLYWFLNLFCF